MTKEIEKLTEQVLSLNVKIDDLGRKSVPLILECGEKLKMIKDSVKKSKLKWTDWQLQHKDRISTITVWRYIKVYDISLLKEFHGKTVPKKFEGMTLNQVYEFCELVSMRDDIDRSSMTPKKPSGDEPQKPSGDEPNPKDDKKEDPQPKGKKTKSKYNKFHSYLCHLQDLNKHEFTDEEISKLVKCGEVYVEWWVEHGGNVGVIFKQEEETLVEQWEAA